MKRKILFYTFLFAAILMAVTTGESVYAQDIKGFRLHSSTLSHDNIPFYVEKEGERTLFTEEPFFKEIKFLKIDPPMSLRERINRLLAGIYTDLPPEYDHYGYEIRRYMASIGNSNVFHNEDAIKDQIQNIKNAEIILGFWHKDLKKEIEEIDKIMEEMQVASSLKTTYKYNRGMVNAFLIECQNWIDNNKKMLMNLQKIGEKLYEYDRESGVITFKNKEDLISFWGVYQAKIKSLQEIRGYIPFRMMIY